MKRTQNLKYYLAGAVALITFVVYLSALQNDFVEWDDNLYVFENLHIRALTWTFFKWAFYDLHAGNWHPLTWVSHALDYAVWGLNPLGHHLTSIIFHSINAFVVVLLIIRLLTFVKERAQQAALPAFLSDLTILITGGATGLLFGLHPLHVESVAWVAERKDLLCALFFMLSIVAYTKFIENRQPADGGRQSEENGKDRPDQKNFLFNKHYLIALGYFIFALLSKPMAVTLPVVLLILDWHPFHRIRSFKSFRSAGVEKLPFFALSLMASLLAVLAQRAKEAMSLTDLIPFPYRVLVAAHSLIAYLVKMIWPFDLVPFYPYPEKESLASAEYLTAYFLVIAITAVCIVMIKKRRLWTAAWGYCIITLLPVLGIVQVGVQAMADRYMYLPSLGPFLILGLAAAWISEKATTSRGAWIIKPLSAAVAVFIVVSLSYLTITQTARWKNGMTFWNYVIENEPGEVPFAYNNRAHVFEKTGRYNEAIADYDKAVALDPGYDLAYNNRGMLLGNLGRLEDALRDFNTAIALKPAFYQAYFNRAFTLGKMGRLDNAIEDYRTAIALHPSSYEAYFQLGIIYGKAGMQDKAIEALSRSLLLNPNYANGYSNRGVMYTLSNQLDRALDDFNKAIELNRNFSMAYVNRGKLFLKSGRVAPALADFQTACDLGDDAGCNSLREAGSGSRSR